jgi:hypothetical protein
MSSGNQPNDTTMLRNRTLTTPLKPSTTAPVCFGVGGSHAIAQKIDRFSPMFPPGRAYPQEEPL